MRFCTHLITNAIPISFIGNFLRLRDTYDPWFFSHFQLKKLTFDKKKLVMFLGSLSMNLQSDFKNSDPFNLTRQREIGFISLYLIFWKLMRSKNAKKYPWFWIKKCPPLTESLARLLLSHIYCFMFDQFPLYSEKSTFYQYLIIFNK